MKTTLTLQAGAVALVLSVLSGCTGGSQPNIEFIQDMMETPAIKSQEFDADSPHQSGMRVPPEHTVPVGFEPYKYGTDVQKASAENKNPLASDTSEAVLWTGMKAYETHCSICHGHKGEAPANHVTEFMALKPPSLLTPKARAYTDGHLYHIITMGQGVMGPYASHVPQKDRWQLVNYIRQLQKKAE